MNWSPGESSQRKMSCVCGTTMTLSGFSSVSALVET